MPRCSLDPLTETDERWTKNDQHRGKSRGAGARRRLVGQPAACRHTIEPPPVDLLGHVPDRKVRSHCVILSAPRQAALIRRSLPRCSGHGSSMRLAWALDIR
jgi:hypothetical protein